jgi:hypothetical protein
MQGMWKDTSEVSEFDGLCDVCEVNALVNEDELMSGVCDECLYADDGDLAEVSFIDELIDFGGEG